MRVRFYTLLTVADWASLTTALLAANAVVAGDLFAESGLMIGRVLLPLYFALATVTDSFSVLIGTHRWRSVARATRALIFAIVAFVLLAFMLKISTEFSRLTVGLGAVFGFTLLAMARYWVARLSPRLLGGNPWDTILICDGAADLTAPSDYTVVVASTDLMDPAVHSPDMFDRLARAIGYADRVVVRCPPERRSVWAAALRGANVQGEIIAAELAPLDPRGLSVSAGEPTIIVAQGPLRLFDRLLKRLFDLLVAVTSLILLAPVMIAVALAVRLTSPGPVFFVQTRIGRQNRLFPMMKFRSMRVEQGDGAGARSAARDDDRVTPVGRLLRRTSLDELPQLINVLVGDMSIIGPRPHALASRAADQLFWEVNPAYWDRHAMKPGLTGLAQVRGFRGATLHRSDLESRIESDMEYVQNWSLQLDLLILARTVLVLFHRNAF